MDLFFWKEKQLRMVWRVEKEGKMSFLVGTSHFFRYSFERPLTRLIRSAEDVLFEGPLDDESMARVTAHGRQPEGTPSLLEALDPKAIREINRQLNKQMVPQSSVGSYLQLLHTTSSNFLDVHARGVRPWMAFFTIWSAYLDWTNSIDMEAFHIAQTRYVPGVSDLLLFEAVKHSLSQRKTYINLGLGINPGVTFFKKKWGGVPFLPYMFYLYSRSKRPALKALFQKLQDP